MPHAAPFGSHSPLRASSAVLAALATGACLRLDVAREANRPPLAAARADPEGPLHVGTVVTLDGSATADPDARDAKMLETRWEQVGGDRVDLEDPSARVTRFAAPMTPQVLLFVLHASDGIDEADSPQVRVVVTDAPPIAQVLAAPQGPVAGGATVTLDGSASADPDPEDLAALTYRWQQVAGTDTVVLEGADAAVAHFSAPRRPQTLLFVLHVSDGVESADSPQVRVDIVNTPPVARVGADPAQPVTGGTAVTLDGSASADDDPGDADRLTWRWEQVAGDTVVLDNPTAAVAHFAAPRRPQTLLFVLHVSDGLAESAAQVAVQVYNTPPAVQVRADPPGAVHGGTVVTLDGAATADADPADAALLRFRWEQVGGADRVALDDPAAKVAHFLAPARPQTLLFVLHATDGVDAVDSAQLAVEVTNATPVARALASPQSAVTGGTVVTLDGTGSTDSDPADSALLSYRWEQVSGTDAVVLDTPAASVAHFEAPRTPQLLLFVLHVSDGNGESAAQVAVRVQDNAPSVSVRVLPEGPVHRGAAVTLDASASADPDPGDAARLTWRWEQVGGSDAVTADSLSAAMLRFTAPAAPQTLAFVVRVSDGLETTESPHVQVVVANAPPSASASASPTGPVTGGTVLTLDGSASRDADPSDSAALSYRWEQVGGLDAVALDSATDAVAQFAAPRTPQMLLFVLHVSDGIARTDSPQVSVRVVNHPPQTAVQATPEGPVHRGEAVTLDASATTDPDPGDAARLVFRWEQVGGSDTVAPDSFDDPVMRFTAPERPQTVLFVVQATDGVESVRSSVVRVVVTNAAPVAAATVAPVGSVVAGDTVTLDGSASADADAEDAGRLSFRWEQIAGSAVVLANPAARVTTFAAPHGGQTLFFALHMSDGVDEATAQVSVPIASSPPVARAGPDQTVHPGQIVALDGTRSSDDDGRSLAYLWEQTSGPAVAISDPSSPSASFAAPNVPGRLEFRLTVTAATTSVSDTAAVTVEDVPVARMSIALGTGVPSDATGRTFAVVDGDRVTLDSSPSAPPAGAALTGVAWQIPADLLGDNPALAAQANAAVLAFAVPRRSSVLVLGLRVKSPGAAGGEIWSDEARVTLAIGVRPLARTGAPVQVLNRTSVRLDGSQSEGTSFLWQVQAVPPGAECCLPDSDGCPTGLPDPQPAVRKCISGATTPYPVFTPFVRGDYTVELTVQNAAGMTSPPAYAIVTALNNTPHANAGGDLSTPNHAAVDLHAGYSDPDGDVVDPLVAPGTSIRWELRSTPSGATWEWEDDAGDAAHARFTPHGKGAYFLSLVVNDGVADSTPDELVIVAQNLAPAAAPPASFSGFNRAPIQLSAGTSSDRDGDPLSYEWTVLGGPSGGTFAFSDAWSAAPLFTADGRGTWRLQLAATDGAATAVAPVTVTVRNNPPVADAGQDIPDQTNTSLVLDGKKSRDPDGDALVSWTWRLVSGPDLVSFAPTGTSTPVAVFQEGGIYVFGLTVSDGQASSAEALVTVSVLNLNHAPIPQAPADQVVQPGTTVTLSATAVDPDANTITAYQWTRETGPAGLPSQLVGATTSFTAPAAYDIEDAGNDAIVWALRVSDDKGATSKPVRTTVYLAPENGRFVFVANGATDSSDCGTSAKPCRSVTTGIVRAQDPARTAAQRNVVVAAGVYDSEPVRSIVVPYGVSLYGGFDPATWVRDPARFVSDIRPPASTPVEIADGLDNDCNGLVDDVGMPVARSEACGDHVDNNLSGYAEEGCGKGGRWSVANHSRAEAAPILLGMAYGDIHDDQTQVSPFFRLPANVSAPGRLGRAA